MPQNSSNTVPIRQRKPRLSFRAFYITVLFISAFAVFSFVADQSARYTHGPQFGLAQRRALESRDVTRLFKRDEECRLVHHAEDKCAFIKANCPDEEAGLLSYLSLYYCHLNKAQPVAFVILTLWLGLLFTTIGIAASDFFCINLSTIASILGVTFLAFGNGSPDVFSTFAAMSSHSGSLAVGELIGAAGFITAVVAGSMALVREFKVGKKTFVRDVGFFIVAASFSMVFLSDGVLQLWECCAMIGFYVFYVIIVVLWHWYLGRRRVRREREAAARSHYLSMTNEEIEVTEEDEDDEDAPAGQGRYHDTEDFGALERGSSPGYGSQAGDDSDEDGDEGRQLAADMASSMRVTRPRGNRRNTITPIRPSLVGALEFRSVLSSLQKSRGSYARPIHLRRYSDDPTAPNTQSQYGGSEPYSDHAPSVVTSQAEDSGISPPRAGSSTRTRAVSMNDAVDVKPTDPSAYTVAQVPNIGVMAATPTFPRHLQIPGPELVPTSSAGPMPPSPTISLSPPPSVNRSRDVSPAPSQERRKRDTLAPPEEGYPGARNLRVDVLKDRQQRGDPAQDSSTMRSGESQRLSLQIPGPSSRDSSRSRTISPVVQFPLYTDSPAPLSARSSKAPSLLLPEATLTPETYGSQDMEYQERQERLIKWWPYSFLPSPYILGSTLFPTLCTWRDKSIWDKFVSVVSVPSIFLLAITLPVVESEPREDEDLGLVLDERLTHTRQRSSTGPILTPDSPSLELEPEWMRYRQATAESQERLPRSPDISKMSGHDTATVAVLAENNHHHSHPTPIPSKQASVDPMEIPSDRMPTPAKDWNRWLVSVQIFTAPLFIVLIIWANISEPTTRRLINLVMYSLLGSLIAFGILALTTTASKPPKYRALLCFLGFVVSIAWISTIANEVVGVLKAFGVILGISDAILGLTIFAVGNSLGDLVADITVARLGYPVMALSACFGGPMLNILIGIGVSGLYMTIKDSNAHHAKHPNKEIKYKPYHIEVSRTLMVSAITLLVTLVGLLIAVPMNKWVMSRRIGWGLIILWSISTIINLGVEISGVWGSTASTL
ncbi:putative cation exchanger [Lachnellula subtilissima]|uniref:Putative cation exchanger n=1 Tax=Lachnellula subtilissima TaxID=602034 RepID=A0A8H8S0C4_9HELO|nr:putative cation exchanger [Lachnellula subtilissima]